jgi:hypothetical protein
MSSISIQSIKPYTSASTITMDELLSMPLDELTVEEEEEEEEEEEGKSKYEPDPEPEEITEYQESQKERKRLFEIEQNEQDELQEKSMEIMHRFKDEIMHKTETELQTLLIECQSYPYTIFTLADIHIWNAWKIQQLQKKMENLKQKEEQIFES